MKKVASLLGMLALLAGVMSCGNQANNQTEIASTEQPKSEAAQQPAPSDGKFGVFTFEHEEFDFGQIKEGDVVEHTFKFTNTGEAPLVITDVQVTCGCTAPEWPKEPVAPGATAEIPVKFNSQGKSGNQDKRITIVANNKEGVHYISIKGMVVADDGVSKMMGPMKKQ